MHAQALQEAAARGAAKPSISDEFALPPLKGGEPSSLLGAQDADLLF